MAVETEGTLIVRRTVRAILLLQQGTFKTKDLALRLGISVRDTQRLIQGLKEAGVLFEKKRRGEHQLRSDSPLYDVQTVTYGGGGGMGMLYTTREYSLTSYGKRIFVNLFGERAKEAENMLNF
ncbi:MAG: hypothetical protein LBC49_05095 [Bacteroidales bacterium]|jgi:biotin operon repressor|nr:hypothetical protein [Bacteroidales bacterium]